MLYYIYLGYIYLNKNKNLKSRIKYMYNKIWERVIFSKYNLHEE